MADENLPPEVEKAIADGPKFIPVKPGAISGNAEEYREFARRIALLAASKAREETEPSVTLKEILQTANHVEQNGINVARFGGEHLDEGRIRQLCAAYLREFVQIHRTNEKLKELNLAESEIEGAIRRGKPQ